MNQETITGTLSWFKILPLSGFNLIRVKQRLHMRRKEVFPNSWSRRTDRTEMFFLIADLEDLEKLDESEICLRRVNAEEVLISPKGDQFIFPVAAGAAKLSVRDFEIREPTPRREQTVKERRFQREELQGEPGRSQPTESTDDAEARADFWSIQGDFINRHHSEPRVQLRAEGRNILDSTEIH